MKSRSTVAVSTVILLGLLAYAAWMWYAPDYSVRFRPGDLTVSVSISGLNRPGGGFLTVFMRNNGRNPILVAESQDLRGPFEILLVNTDTRQPVPRPAAREAQPGPVCRSLPAGAEHGWSMPLDRLFGPLPRGRYAASLVYDTERGAAAGEEWSQGLDIGHGESSTVVFEVGGSPPKP